MKIKTVYVAVDGTTWDTEGECLTYEYNCDIVKNLTSFIYDVSDLDWEDSKEIAAHIVSSYDIKKKS